MLSKQAPTSLYWYRHDGVINTTVIHDGAIDPQWVTWSHGLTTPFPNDYPVGSDCFELTTGVVVEVVILTGFLFDKGKRRVDVACVEAERRLLLRSNFQTAPLIRKVLTRKQLEKWNLKRIIVTYEPLNDPNNNFGRLLSISANDPDDQFSACSGRLDRSWSYPVGFAFVRIRTGSQPHSLKLVS